MLTLRRIDDGIKLEDRPDDGFEPTAADWADYREFCAEIDRKWAAEREDRREVMEQIRREKVSNARSAAARLRGVSAALCIQGLESSAGTLLQCARDVESVLTLL